MLTKSEILFCSAAAVGLVAFSVANHIDPAVATRNFADTALQATVYGLKTGAHYLYLAGKASAIVFGSYTALKGAVVAGRAIKRKVQARFEASIQDESEDDLSCEDEAEEAYVAEDEIEIAVADADFRINTWNEADYRESDDEDFDEQNEEVELVEAIIPDEPLNAEEIALLLADQKRVTFYHGELKLPPLLPIENTSLKGPYHLRPR